MNSGLKLTKAYNYLGDVADHKQCIPFRRFKGDVGRTGQARQFKVTFQLQEATCRPVPQTRTVIFEIAKPADPAFTPPNIITPNGDDKNQYFTLAALPSDFCDLRFANDTFSTLLDHLDMLQTRLTNAQDRRMVKQAKAATWDTINTLNEIFQARAALVAFMSDERKAGIH